MKKTLTLLAILAAIGPAWGADVVSSNIVGYEKVSLTKGYSMIGVQFVQVGGGSQDLSSVAVLDDSMAGFDEGGNYATIVEKGHPALEGLPHDGFCGWQFRRLMEGGRAVQLEAGVPFGPIVEVASSDKFVVRQAMLFEYRVGAGRLLVCSFKFGGGDPAAAWLLSRLVEYAGSDAFAPRLSLTPGQLRAVATAPLLDGGRNTNKARNPSDPSSLVRAGPLAQP